MADAPYNCPYCGGPARTFNYNGTLQGTCAAKNMRDCAGTDVVAPLAMWNTRATPPVSVVEAMERALVWYSDESSSQGDPARSALAALTAWRDAQ